MSTILVISPEPWDGHFVSKHHYARELSRRGHRVLFHGPPDISGPMRLVAAPDTPGELRVLHAPRVAPGLRFMPPPLRRALEAHWLTKVERLASARVDVVWNFENSRFFDLRFAGKRLKIYQQVDLNQDFHPETAAVSADLVVALSRPIEARLKSFAPNLVRLTHGHAAHPSSGCLPDEVESSFGAAPINVVMVGNLDIPYLDVPLVAKLVAAHPNVRFHFVGGYSPGKALHGAIARAPNVMFWGRQPSHLLPGFLARADTLLVAYLADQYLEQLANPHKILEYLASGRCVLATRTLEYEENPGLIEIARNRDEFIAKFAEIVALPEAWNTPELIAKRQSFAEDNTYSRQLDRIAETLGTKGHLIS